MSVTSATWSGGATLPSGLAAALAGALSATMSNSTGSGSGSIAVTFSAADSAFDFLAAGQTLNITYNVTLADDNGVSSSQPVTVTITGTNDVPVIGGVATGSVTEDVNVVAGNISTSGALTIADPDEGESNFTPQAGTVGNNGYGTFTLAADGTWTYTANNSQTAIQQLGNLQFLTDSFTAVSSDGTAPQLVTVTIIGTDDAPVVTPGAAAVVSEEGLPNGIPDIDTTNSTIASGTITASDVDIGDVLTMSLGTPTTPLTSGGVAIAWTLENANHTLVGRAGTTPIITVTITDAGVYTVTLTGPVDHPIANQEDILAFSVPVNVSDGHVTTPTSLSITIDDDTPTVTANAAVQLDDDALPGGIAGGTGDGPDAVNTTGTLAHSYGADGAGTTLLTTAGAVLPQASRRR